MISAKFISSKPRPKHNKKIITILFFVYFVTHSNKIHTIYKQTRVFLGFFHVDVLFSLAKQQQQKSVNLYTILGSMLGPCSNRKRLLGSRSGEYGRCGSNS
jgi:hypothetical protein